VTCARYSLYVKSPDEKTVIGLMTPDLNPCDTHAQLLVEKVQFIWCFAETSDEDYEHSDSEDDDAANEPADASHE
jgi:hypothetical protein